MDTSSAHQDREEAKRLSCHVWVLADFLSRQPLTQALASLEHRLAGADGMNVMRAAGSRMV